MDGFGFIALVVVIVGLVVIYKVQATKAKRARLMEKYGVEQVVEGIMKHSFWQGMTSEMLRDSIGNPVDVGRRVNKSKTVETYKYNQTGRNRFATRITVENGYVVGWELK